MNDRQPECENCDYPIVKQWENHEGEYWQCPCGYLVRWTGPDVVDLGISRDHQSGP